MTRVKLVVPALVCAWVATIALGCSSTATVDTGARPAAAGPPAAASGGGSQTGSGPLDAEVAEITSDLTDTEKACIESTPGAAAAADQCVAPDKLGRQIARQFLDSPLLKGMTSDERAMIERCIVDAVSNADAAGLGDLATNDESAMRTFSQALSDCMNAQRPTAPAPTTARAAASTTVDGRTTGTARAAGG